MAQREKLKDLAVLIRSKNAGPFELTFDIMFDDPAIYERVKASNAVNARVIGELYGVPLEDVKFFHSDNALALKASIPRPHVQGDLGDTDMHGGQQYAPLMDLEIP